MPTLTFPVQKSGLLVDVVIGLSGAMTTALVAAGQRICPPICARGELDTGSNVTAVSPAILRQLGIPIHYQTTTQTASGKTVVNVFQVSVGIRDLADPTGASPVESTLSVMELPTPLPIDVLVGLDFLLNYRFLLDGPARQFSLDF